MVRGFSNGGLDERRKLGSKRNRSLVKTVGIPTIANAGKISSQIDEAALVKETSEPPSTEASDDRNDQEHALEGAQ